MTTPDGRSQRVHDRVPALLAVTFRLPGKAAFIERYAANVSKGGIFIVSKEVHPIGSEIRFEIRSVDGNIVFSGRGIVRWTQLHDPVTKKLPGLGVQFTALDEENRGVLEKLLALQSNTLADSQPEFGEDVPPPSSTPSESSEQLAQANYAAQVRKPASVSAEAPRDAWPNAIPPTNLAREIVEGRGLPDAGLREASEQFSGDLTAAERASLSETWPAGVANQFRSVLTAQWRLTMALKTRPERGATDEGGLDQLFAEADDALAVLAELSQSVMPEVKAACASARVNVARLVQELLPTSDARAIAADVAAGEASKKQRQDRLAAAAAPVVTIDKTPAKEQSTWVKKLGTRGAVGLAAVSLVATVVTLWSNFAPPKVEPVPSLPALPENCTVLGNPESGQVIVQRIDQKPFAPEAVEEFVKRANARGIRVSRMVPTQLLLSTEKSAP